ncbi:VOC family protein [Serinibacter arcticus]|uniref:Putative dioxygenase n=1 Tax=Serinibacter arcticus TaxID=1655435 RepID=A0A4Z1E1F5_9MICO|nr:VOC family protein [Serinibacter arcticus]TGO05049.1 putative dioxygenase [Serinibacter arcticus]
MSLRGFATLNFYADDVPAAVAWYTSLLGIAPYFERNGPDGSLAYAEFRVGDLEAELGIISSAWRRPDAARTPGGAVMHWAVDDLEATVARLRELGATEWEPITHRGEGFTTASVLDPFGNVLGVMTNPHYVERVSGSATR